MEPAWSSVDFTVDISESYERKQAAIAAYASVFHGDPSSAPNPFLSVWLIQVGAEDPGMDWLIFVGVLALWWLLQAWLLPRLDVPT